MIPGRRSSPARGLWAAAALALAGEPACRGDRGRAPREAAPTGAPVIAFGDSLTAGYRMRPGQSYPDQLSRLLGVAIVNKGVSGDTTEDALARLERDVLAQRPRVVLVCLGANDMLRRMPPERQFANLETIVRRIQGRGARVVLIGVEGYGGLLPGVDYAARYRALAERTGAFHVPHLLAGVVGDRARMYDDIHPNAAGYETIARRLAREAGPYVTR